MESCRVLGRVEWDAVEPGIESVDEYVDEVRPSKESFAGGAECCEQPVSPWFSIRVVAAK
jgi:hypothetical protein